MCLLRGSFSNFADLVVFVQFRWFAGLPVGVFCICVFWCFWGGLMFLGISWWCLELI